MDIYLLPWLQPNSYDGLNITKEQMWGHWEGFWVHYLSDGLFLTIMITTAMPLWQWTPRKSLFWFALFFLERVQAIPLKLMARFVHKHQSSGCAQNWGSLTYSTTCNLSPEVVNVVHIVFDGQTSIVSHTTHHYGVFVHCLKHRYVQHIWSWSCK